MGLVGLGGGDVLSNEAKVKTPVALVVPPNDLGSREIKHHRATSLLAG